MPKILSYSRVVAVTSSLSDVCLVDVITHDGRLVGPDAMDAGYECDVARATRCGVVRV